MKKACHQNSAFFILHSAFPRGFTLVELLVVISIIAILAGLVMPMFYSTKERAREAKAKVAVKALETAFKSYLDTYKVWPDGFPDGKISDDIFKTLRGENPGVSPGYNPQNIAFYEFGSTNSTETKAYDPWADPAGPNYEEHVYRVMFDKDYNNKINIDGQDVYRCVVVWSPGNDGDDDSGGNDDVASWK